MVATTRRARNYKEKNSGFTFGHFALPVAAVIALGLLFVGIKLFFLTPPQRAGIPVTKENVTQAVHNSSTPVAQEPDFALADNAGVSEEFTVVEPEKLETTDVAIVLARPLSQPGRSVSSQASAQSSAKVNRTDTRRAAAAPAPVAKPQAQASAQSAGAKSKWGVQVGAFVNEGSASTLVSEIKKQGYGAFVSKVDSSGKTFHRVRVGAGDTREDASRLATELEQKGYPVTVVPML